jgi:LysR family transcriptional regulator, regulator for bpeEF and oprC
MRTYPELKVVLNATNERRDLVKEGSDVAIRVGHLEDSTLMMKRLSIDRAKLFASDAYLQTYGEPQSIADLKNHPSLAFPTLRTNLLGRCITIDEKPKFSVFAPV